MAVAQRQAPKVSVLTLTYNQERFIEQCVRSVMMQQTTFPFELVIGEDCSTDDTRAVLLRLQAEFPDQIKLLLHERNLGLISNTIASYNACRGEYIAWLDGDDYWTSAHKLQWQVEYMEQHPDCRLCFHTARVVNVDGQEIQVAGRATFNHEQKIEINSILARNDITTAAVMFRAVDGRLPAWFAQLRTVQDWPLYFWLSLHDGYFCYLETEPMASYRLHVESITHVMRDRGRTNTTNQQYEGRLLGSIADTQLIARQLPHWQRRYLRPRFFQRYLALARLHIEQHQFSASRGDCWHALRYFPINHDFQKNSLQLLKALIRACLRLPPIQST
ncbi:MAG: glycosyltransferase [Anaerolineae bacterium]|nr:glycosyltransferase [Anaerolineae bacterium]